MKAQKRPALIYNNTGIPLNSNNSITVLKNGKDTFESIFEAIKDAKNFIHLQYYIIK